VQHKNYTLFIHSCNTGNRVVYENDKEVMCNLMGIITDLDTTIISIAVGVI